MKIWLGLAMVFWGAILLFWDKRGNTDILFRFFDGLLLAFLCVCLLPMAFYGDYFWLVACGLLFGVLIGAVLEQKIGMFFLQPLLNNVLHCAVFSAAIWFYRYGSIVFWENQFFYVAVSFFGGLFLFVACGGILPDSVCGKERLAKAMGGFVGFFLGIILLCGIL